MCHFLDATSPASRWHLSSRALRSTLDRHYNENTLHLSCLWLPLARISRICWFRLSKSSNSPSNPLRYSRLYGHKKGGSLLACIFGKTRLEFSMCKPYLVCSSVRPGGILRAFSDDEKTTSRIVNLLSDGLLQSLASIRSSSSKWPSNPYTACQTSRFP